MGAAILGCPGVILADSTSVPTPVPQQPTKWNIPLINQGNGTSWTVDSSNLTDDGGGEDNARSDLMRERFPEDESSDPDMVFPGQNSYEDLNMGDDFDPMLMQSIGER